MSLAGGAVGTLVAWGGIHVVRAACGGLLTRLGDLALNGRLLAFALAASVATGIVAGLVPALRLARTDLTRWLHGHTDSGHVAGRMALSLRLVVGEIALAVVSLMIGGLLAQSFVRLSSVDLGFDPAGVLAAELSLSRQDYSGRRGQAFFDELTDRVVHLPNVAKTPIVSALPGGPAMGGGFIEAQGHMPGPAPMRIISPDYFAVLSIPIVAGRAFSGLDTATGLGVAMVNDEFARAYWGSAANALGKRIAVGASAGGRGARTDAEMRAQGHVVVGVAGTLREHGHLTPAYAEMYLPFAQAADLMPPQMVLVLRAQNGRAAALAPPLRTLMGTLDPHQPLYNVRTLEQVMGTKLARERVLVAIWGAFAGLTLALATMGVHGVFAYVTAMRRRELAIRLALGSTPAGVRRLVLRSAVGLVARGVAVPVALALTWFASSRLIAVTDTDPWTCAAMVAVVVVTALAGSLSPAWRASRAQPATALGDQ